MKLSNIRGWAVAVAALAAATAALSGLSQAAGVVLAPKQELRLKQLSFVPLSPDRALAVLVAPMAASRIGSCHCPWVRARWRWSRSAIMSARNCRD